MNENLKSLPHRSAEEMLDDYAQLHASPYSARRYFDTSKMPQALPEKTLQLFWRSANGKFEEKESILVAPLGRERQLVRLHFLTATEPIEQIRFE